MSDSQDIDVRGVCSLLAEYFPQARVVEENSSLTLADGGSLLFRDVQIIPYLQTAFFEEHLVEVQVVNTTRVFSTVIVDQLPPWEEKIENGELRLVTPEYETGSYLKKGDYFLLAPLTPAIGNVTVRQSHQLIVRFFFGTTAIELGCCFESPDEVRAQPVLRVGFPRIGRINRGFRSYRVKVVSSVDAKVVLEGEKFDYLPERSCQIVDISARGLGFALQKNTIPLSIGEEITFRVKVAGLNELQVKGAVRRFESVRGSHGADIICGVQYDLESRALAAELEKVAAAVQRFQLRELAEKTANLSGVTIIR